MAGASVMAPEALAKWHLSGWRKRLFSGKLAGNIAFWAAATILLVFTAMVLWPEAIAPYNPRLGRLADRHKPPGYVDATGGAHWLGTDHQGHDVLSLVIYGAQVSLTVGYSGGTIGAVVGIAIGLLAGYRGGTFDQVAMRGVDALLSFPYILIAIVWAVTIGSGVLNLMTILAVRGWVEFARVGRGQSLAIREREYITAVRALWRERPAHHAAAPPDQYHGTHAGGGLSIGAFDSAGGDAVVSGARGRTAHAGLGKHALRCARLLEYRLVDGDLPRHRDCAGGVGRQLHGRQPA